MGLGLRREVRLRRATDPSKLEVRDLCSGDRRPIGSVLKTGLGTILVLLLTMPAFAQTLPPPPEQPFVIASDALVAATMTDLAVSTYLIGAGRGREAGLGAGLEERPVLFCVLKGSVTASEIALLRALHRRHPRVALWMTVSITSLEVAATWHNARLLNTR